MTGERNDQLLGNVIVSRETIQRLESFVRLIRRWSPQINLIGKAEISHLWERHIVDSAQLVPLVSQEVKHWVDLGSGGGFPALVVACLHKELRPDVKHILIESDQRKCVFLETVIRELGLKDSCSVCCERIESIPATNADVLSARALKPLPELLRLAERHIAPGGIALFPKGQKAQEEISVARLEWDFDLTAMQSITSKEATILCIEGIKRV